MPDVEWKAPDAGALDSRGLVSAFRLGRFTPTTMRIVLDVSKPVKVAQSFVLAPSAATGEFRLVVDIEPVSAAEFDRLAREPRSGGGASAGKAPERPKAPPKPPKHIIVVDPGHGGIDPGTIGRAGTQEKDITLAMAVELKRQLEATGR